MIINGIKKHLFQTTKTGKELYDNIEIVCEVLSEELKEPVKSVFNPNDISRHGSCNAFLATKEPKRLEIGISDFWKLTEEEFLAYALITLYHEARHFEQLIEIKNQTANEQLLFSNLAKHDYIYYENNYHLFYDELDADHAGIVYMYQYMTKYHPEIDVIPYIVNFLKAKSNYYSDAISIKNIDDIETYFERKCEELIDQVKRTEFSDEESPVRRLKENLRSNYEIYDRDTGITSDNLYFHACKTNLECDKFVSMAILKENPEYMEYYTGANREKLEELTLEYFIDQAIEEASKDTYIRE